MDLFFISEKFITAIKNYDGPGYILAAKAKVSPPILSRAINGREVFKKGDQRLQRIADAIGYKEEIYEKLPARQAVK